LQLGPILAGTTTAFSAASESTVSPTRAVRQLAVSATARSADAIAIGRTA
jgi:hypothetical protein